MRKMFLWFKTILHSMIVAGWPTGFKTPSELINKNTNSNVFPIHIKRNLKTNSWADSRQDTYTPNCTGHSIPVH